MIENALVEAPLSIRWLINSNKLGYLSLIDKSKFDQRR